MKQDLEYNQLYKLILVGDAGVGKTHLLNKYVKNTLPKNPVPTIGVQFATKTVTLKNNEKVKAQIWDTAGQQQYRSITMAHYRRACGALIVYDITKQRSFISVKRWLQNIKDQADPEVVIMLVGNKTDLQSERSVKRQQGQAFARQANILFQQTSAKQQSIEKLDGIFKKLLNQLSEKEINLARQLINEAEPSQLKIKFMRMLIHYQINIMYKLSLCIINMNIILCNNYNLVQAVQKCIINEDEINSV